MKAIRFSGANARTVLKQVRAQLGDDAVILSNRPGPEGVEIVALAARDMDLMDDIQSVVDTAAPALDQDAPAVHATTQASTADARAKAAARRAQEVAEQVRAASAKPLAKPARSLNPMNATAPAARAASASTITESQGETLLNYVNANRAPVAAVVAPVTPVAPMAPVAADSDTASMMAEIRAMKALLQEQLAGAAWEETRRKQPARATALRKLMDAGFSALMSRKLAEKLPADSDAEGTLRWLTDVLARNIPCAAGADIVEQGGAWALVGPTGVGKTTTAAKLAARCVMKFGAARLGLITTDGYRIGAQDQLRIYGRILGVPVLVANDATELQQALEALGDKHLVLIDTTGMGQRDERVAEQHRMLSARGVKRLLLLNATSQGETLDEVARAYAQAGAQASEDAAPLAGAILSKVDEAARLGAAVDVIVRHKLALHYVTSGQRVPEDIHAANAQVLAHRSLRAPTNSAFAMNDDEVGLMLAGARA
jgi:flagellar biosynthesis protein FlhF